METSRNEISSARSNRSNQGNLSNRNYTPREDNNINTARSISSKSDQLETETYRSTMSTTRVYTALAALTAEKEALKSKLALIDSQLEENSKRKVLSVRK